MNFILNENNLDLNNIEFNYKNNKSIKLNYIIHNLKLNGIPFIINDNHNYKIIKNNIYNYFKNNDKLFIQLKLIDDFLNSKIVNYKSFINNNYIKIKYIHKEIDKYILFSLSNVKLKYGFFFLNIFQI